MPSVRCSWCADMPFLLDAIRRKASSHLCIRICDRSVTEPTRAVNFSRHLLHQYQPGPTNLPPRGATVSKTPQCGQYGPSGQRIASKVSQGCERAAGRVIAAISLTQKV